MEVVLHHWRAPASRRTNERGSEQRLASPAPKGLTPSVALGFLSKKTSPTLRETHLIHTNHLSQHEQSLAIPLHPDLMQIESPSSPLPPNPLLNPASPTTIPAPVPHSFQLPYHPVFSLPAHQPAKAPDPTSRAGSSASPAAAVEGQGRRVTLPYALLHRERRSFLVLGRPVEVRLGFEVSRRRRRRRPFRRRRLRCR